MTKHWELCPAVERRPDIFSGAWVFTGTRVPLHALFENLQGGATITEFIDYFPDVTLEQAKAALGHEAKLLLEFPRV